MHVLLISPFHGFSSHAAWAEGLSEHSRHRVTIIKLSDESWSWRLKGGCVPLWQRLKDWEEPVDLLLTTSLTCLASLHGLLRRSPLAALPTVYYMHENQLTYPIRPGGRRDPQLVLRQFHSQLAADEIWFNSAHNRRSWFKSLPSFLSRFKDHQGLELLPGLQRRSRVMPLGLSLNAARPGPEGERPILLWNQRWAWEKGVDRFKGLIEKFGPDAAFDVVLLGQASRDPARLELEEFLGPRLLHSGWCSREKYLQWLGRASLTVSVARHEFFGISLLEAAACGVMLFLPNGLSYPEILPAELHPDCLYTSQKELFRRVKSFLQEPERYRETTEKLRKAALGYCWTNQASRYDEELERVAVASDGP